ncbi:MAG: potassium transporter TrkA [Gammaproteobacteria bacterium]|nr:potassium transporter TrkA [Gammaproteobacteria bacterium]
MLAALSLLIVLTLSIAAVRTGATALRLTGMPEDVARFQARSAFTGAGFTTSESEAIVNHPVRRRIVSTLMVVGSIGLVSMMTTIIVPLVGADSGTGNVLYQLLWLMGVALVLWCVVLNPRVDGLMCAAIARLLERAEGFGARQPVRLLQMPASHSVMRVLVHRGGGLEGRSLAEWVDRNVTVLGIEREDGTFVKQPDLGQAMQIADEVFVYGPDEALGAMHALAASSREARR